MKLLVDMNLSPRWVYVLKAAGHDAVHWSDVGVRSAGDSEIMAHALAEDRVVLTHDLDFSAILAATRGARPSVVQIRSDSVSPQAVGDQVLAALVQLETDLRSGALVTVEPKRTRLRVLPF